MISLYYKFSLINLDDNDANKNSNENDDDNDEM